MVLDYRLCCLEYNSTICHLLCTRLKWVKSIWRYLVCKHLSDSNFFLFVLKFNYGCIWNKINGDHFSPTDGVFECALMVLCKPWGEREGCKVTKRRKNPKVPGFLQDSSGPPFPNPQPLSSQQRKLFRVLILLHQLMVLRRKVVWPNTHCLHLYIVLGKLSVTDSYLYFMKGIS